MNPFKVFVSVFFLVSGCKERSVLTDSNDLLSGKCYVSSFTEFNRSYSFHYDRDNLLIQGFRNVTGFEPILYQTFEYEKGKLVTMKRVDLEGKSYPEAKFEYGSNGIIVIRKFDGVRRIYPDTSYHVTETERIEFKYGFVNKPVSLTRWLKEENSNEFFKSHTSEFVYDSEGNLTIEKTYISPKAGIPESNYYYEYFYDDKVNTRKQLNYLFFSATESAPDVFSTNNKVRIKLTYQSQVIKDHKFDLQYDNNDNVMDDDYRFSAMLWKCR